MNTQAIKTNQAALTFPDVLLGIFAISFVTFVACLAIDPSSLFWAYVEYVSGMCSVITASIILFIIAAPKENGGSAKG